LPHFVAVRQLGSPHYLYTPQVLDLVSSASYSLYHSSSYVV